MTRLIVSFERRLLKTGFYHHLGRTVANTTTNSNSSNSSKSKNEAVIVASRLQTAITSTTKLLANASQIKSCHSTKLCRYGVVNPLVTEKANTETESEQHQRSHDSTICDSNSKRPSRYGMKKYRSGHRDSSHPPDWTTSSSSSYDRNKQPDRNFSTNKFDKTTAIQENELHPRFYYGSSLRPADAKGYKAAGILLLRFQPDDDDEDDNTSDSNRYFEVSSSSSLSSINPNTTTNASTKSSSSNSNRKRRRVQVLLCAEQRTNKKKHNRTANNSATTSPRTSNFNNTIDTSASRNLEINLLGGKIESTDEQDARRTAAREFWEETGELVSHFHDCQRLVGIVSETGKKPAFQDAPLESEMMSMTTIWCGPGKYVLHVMHENNEQQQQKWNEVPLKYWQKLQSKESLSSGSEADYLVWVDWDLIVQECQGSRSRSKHAKESPLLSFQVPLPMKKDETITSSDTGDDESNNSMSLQFSFFTTSVLSNKVVQAGVNSTIRKMNQSNQTSKRDSSVTQEQSDIEAVSESIATLAVKDD